MPLKIHLLCAILFEYRQKGICETIMLKRVLSLALCLGVVFLFACSEKSKESTATAAELLEKAMENVFWENDIHTIDEKPLEEPFFNYYYGVSMSEFSAVIADYAIAEQKGSSANEIGIFKICTEFDEEAFRAASDLTGDALDRETEIARSSFVEENLRMAKEFCENRKQVFLNKTANYDAAENEKAQGATIDTYGNYVYYIISGDNATFEATIRAQINAKAV